jgi:hypothetical protein
MNEMKFFTPREANQTLPLVRRIVADILAIGKHIRERSLAVAARPEEDPEIVELIETLEGLFEELEGLGCSYKDWNFESGLVDFPAVIEGQEVMLCWRSDEPGLLFYHDAEAGFAGRRPIPQELFEK